MPALYPSTPEVEAGVQGILGSIVPLHPVWAADPVLAATKRTKLLKALAPLCIGESCSCSRQSSHPSSALTSAVLHFPGVQTDALFLGCVPLPVVTGLRFLLLPLCCLSTLASSRAFPVTPLAFLKPQLVHAWSLLARTAAASQTQAGRAA